jgi:ribonuclease VapC
LSVVLDASALLALLNDEPGAGRVEESLADAAISAVNYAEVGTRLADRGEDAETIQQMLMLLGLEVVPFDVEQADQAIRLRGSTKAAGLSIGDRACLSLAALLERPALTADRAWRGIDAGCTVELIR